MVENNLFENAMEGQWEKVLEAYKNPMIQETKITSSKDTALHIAVSDGQTDIVLKLVESIGQNASKILTIKNERGNTPLHLAAALGNVDMCHCMASKDHKLIAARNNESETPLFLAALHGQKMAFLCLHYIYHETDYSICRKNNGDTILHSAISGEYFSLAFQITCFYPHLMNWVNVKGLTPLHILASKPKAFKSSSHLGLFDHIIYRCIFVDELKEETYDPEAYSHNSANNRNYYPENYKTCMAFFRLIMTLFQVLSKPHRQNKHSNTGDEENPQQKSSTAQGEGTTGASSSAKQSESKDAKENKSVVKRSGSNRGLPKKQHKKDHNYPANYATIILFFQLMMKALLIILGFGIWRIRKITEKKERHISAFQVMNKLVQRASLYKYDNNGRKPQNSRPDENVDTFKVLEEPTTLDNNKMSQSSATNVGKNSSTESQNKDQIGSGKKETPILIAAKMGVVEVVEKILDTFPVAIQDLDSDEKNVVLLAVENRQPRVYKLLLNRKRKESVFRQVDNEGNSALHLAAMYGEYRPWLIPGAALQMQWEIKWYKFVKNSMAPHFFAHYNKKGESPKEIFTKSHKDLVKSGSKWLTKTSESCSVIAALIATVAFATSSTVPGGLNQKNGEPILEKEPGFDVFAISSLVALCFSVTALAYFLAILTSRYQEHDFYTDLPRKLLLGLTSLFASIGSMLISFCSGHFYVLEDKLRTAAYPIYAATCLPLAFFALAQLPLFFDLMWAILKKVPQPSYKVFPH